MQADFPIDFVVTWVNGLKSIHSSNKSLIAINNLFEPWKALNQAAIWLVSVAISTCKGVW